MSPGADHPFGPLWIPELPARPRDKGLTSILDKGLGPGQVRDLIATAGDWIDVVKMGWGTSRFQPEPTLRGKIDLFREAGVEVCTGGTLLEIAQAQGRVSQVLEGARRLGFTMIEVSNGVHPMSASQKLELIVRAREAGFRVWSEVGKKDPEEDARLTLEQRLDAVRMELAEGAEKVVLEARESGTLGIYSPSGEPADELIHRLVEAVDARHLVFEAPRKSQQVWMIRNLGADVSLGNVAPEDALSLVTLRTGFRGDTFADVHLPGIEVFLEVGVHGAMSARRRGGVVVLVDALRASATIVTALASGMKAVRPVASAEECVPRPGHEEEEITAGERGGRKLPAVRHGNSPTELLGQSYEGKTLVLTTSNGTECLTTAAGPGSQVLVGTTLNRSAVARAALRLATGGSSSITLLLAGRNNRVTEEDALAAGEILRALQAIQTVRLHRLPEDAPLVPSRSLEAAFFASESGANLVSLGYEEDVRLCAQVDRFDAVPVFEKGWIRLADSEPGDQG